MKFAIPFLCLLSTSAFAQQTSSGSFQVSTSVQGACVLSAAALNFGEYNVDTGNTANSVISVQCTAGSTNVEVYLSEGLNPAADSRCEYPKRRLISTDGQSYLEYDVRSTSNPFGPWGCAPREASGGVYNGRRINSFPSSLTPQTVVTSSSIARQQNAPIGSYSDTIDVTVVF